MKLQINIVTEWQDKPDSKGWWWLIREKGEGIAILHFPEHPVVERLMGKYPNAKWSKAIVPEFKEDL